MPPVPRSVLVVFVFVGSVAVGPAGEGVAAAQSLQPAPAVGVDGGSGSADDRFLRSVYGIEAPTFRIVMRGADKSAYPVFIGAPLVAWSAWLVRGREGGADAYRLTAAQIATYGAASGVKALVRRPRPYAVLPDIQSRSPRYSPLGPEGDSFAFPSGHAAMSFAIATSWSLSHPEWYVIGPGAVWASAVSLSRIWLGVHYPSDALAGALLGTALAVGVHLMGPSLTPGVLDGTREESSMPLVRVQIRL